MAWAGLANGKERQGIPHLGRLCAIQGPLQGDFLVSKTEGYPGMKGSCIRVKIFAHWLSVFGHWKPSLRPCRHSVWNPTVLSAKIFTSSECFQ